MERSGRDDDAALTDYLISLKISVDEQIVQEWAAASVLSEDVKRACEIMRSTLALDNPRHSEIAFDIAFSNFAKMSDIVNDVHKSISIAHVVSRDIKQKHDDYILKNANSSADGYLTHNDLSPDSPNNPVVHQTEPPRKPLFGKVRPTVIFVSNTLMVLGIVAIGFMLGLLATRG
ncbi:MAG: hypothetical protein WCO00_10645 [Rhodospirillaceae bacterium]